MTEIDSVETLLADLFENRWPADRNTYRLNTALKLRPWWPPLVRVWQARGRPAEPATKGTAYWEFWPQAEALLAELHQQYLKSKGGAQ